MRIGVLTSSRADFGIYLPLLEKLKRDNTFEVEIITFGAHLSIFYGYTIKQIEEAGFNVKYKIETLLATDSPASISTSMGLTIIKFGEFWKNYCNEFDLIFCLGDRYEMFAAVIAGVPFQIPFAHLHGGETTLGAIDNVFRHAITLASKYHFVSTDAYKQKVEALTASTENIFNVGALGLDNLSSIKMLSLDEFKQKWSIDLTKKTILTTFHPETVNFDENTCYASELIKAIDNLIHYQVIITLPNNDTAGNEIRMLLIKAFSKSDRVFLIENLGTASYFTAMANCSMLLGNTSSGIIEAASFGRYVINIGDRQKGRLSGKNVIHTDVSSESILQAVKKIETLTSWDKTNMYYNNGASDSIIKVLHKMDKLK